MILLLPNKMTKRKNWEFDAVSVPQLQRELLKFWKMRLNLCSQRWPSPGKSRVITLIHMWLWLLKRLLGMGLIDLTVKPFWRTPTIGIENIESKMRVLQITYYCRTTHNGCLYYCIPLIMVGWVAVNDSPFGDTFQ